MRRYQTIFPTLTRRQVVWFAFISLDVKTFRSRFLGFFRVSWGILDFPVGPLQRGPEIPPHISPPGNSAVLAQIDVLLGRLESTHPPTLTRVRPKQTKQNVTFGLKEKFPRKLSGPSSVGFPPAMAAPIAAPEPADKAVDDPTSEQAVSKIVTGIFFS